MKKMTRLHFYYGIFRGALAKLIYGNTTRTEKLIRDTYNSNYINETNEKFLRKNKLMFVGRNPVHLKVLEYKRELMLRFADCINKFGAESVLELGCGRGFNLLALAIFCPRVKVLRGIELTQNGVEVARRNLSEPPLDLIQEITGVEKDIITRRLTEVSFSVQEGSILRLPFQDNSFDIVFSNSVIEQIPREYSRVFSECLRVARHIGIWSEPFSEAQGWNIFYKMFLKNTDYFCASYKEVIKVGWKFVSFIVPNIQKHMFRTGFLVCEKTLLQK